MKCPGCGADLNYLADRKIYKCEFCGHEEHAVEQVVTQAVRPADNLFITNLAPSTQKDPTVQITVSDANVSFTLARGGTMSLQLAPGPHTIFYRSGKFSGSLVVVLAENGAPVKVVYNGAKNFVIDQPFAGEAYKDLVNGKKGTPASTRSTVAFILSLTLFLSWVGFIIGFIDIVDAAKKKTEPHPFSALAMCLGLILGILGFIVMISMAVNGVNGIFVK